MNTDMAFAYCERLATAHYENFPIGYLVPKEKRPHFYSIYAFARTADDFADEPQYEGDRQERLKEWRQNLSDCYQGRAEHPIFIALQQTAECYDLPESLFQDLLTAFLMDTKIRRYPAYSDLLYYCRHSANPVGRLILLLFGYRDEERCRLSDYICTALQLTNFWQDVSIDLKKNRIYIPKEDMERFSYSEERLKRHDYNENLAELMRFQVDRTERLFALGRALPDMTGRGLRFELRCVWLGGMTILQKIAERNYNIFYRPKISAINKLFILFKAFQGFSGIGRENQKVAPL
ncbi:MAG: squalene synthase HpnC [Candidatus Cloacimonetes bacterium 4572_55]|nr:MAG: squalene synthase HpnC [Candidatus Cloacimonetes bacterium 4572_55]